MQRPRLHRNDALLLLLAVLVVVGAVYTVKQGSGVPQADVSTAAPAETALPASPSATPVPTESATLTPTGTWLAARSKLSPGPYRLVGMALMKLTPCWRRRAWICRIPAILAMA